MEVVQDHKQKTGDREEGSAKPFNFPPLYGNGFSEYHYEFVVKSCFFASFSALVLQHHKVQLLLPFIPVG